jgi:hypothetical protein
MGVRLIGFTNAEICNDFDAALSRILVELRAPFA